MGFRDMILCPRPCTILLLGVRVSGIFNPFQNIQIARSPGTNTVKTLLGTGLALTLPTITNLKQHRTKFKVGIRPRNV